MPLPVQAYVALVDSSGNAIGTMSPVVPPGGRLTLTTATPVQTATVATAANVLYTPYINNYIPIWNGSVWVPTVFTELTNVLANSSVGNAGPAAGAASKNYDLFVWNNSGTLYLTRGAAWFSDTARSTATENDLQRVQGVLCNLNAITNGPAAGYGIYVGTVRTDAGGATVSWALGGVSAGGTPATLNVWNMHNRVSTQAIVRDSTASWTYTSATPQAANASNNNRVSLIRGLNDEPVDASYQCRFTTAAAANAFGSIGLGLDATNAFAANQGLLIDVLAAGQTGASMIVNPGLASPLIGLGFHFIQACENSDGTHVTTFTGSLSMALRVQTNQ